MILWMDETTSEATMNAALGHRTNTKCCFCFKGHLRGDLRLQHVCSAAGADEQRDRDKEEC